MTEDHLLQRAQRGEPDAVEALCRREWRPVYGLLYHALQDRAEAEDLTQEVFVRALGSLDTYRDTGVPFRAFLVTVARNLLRSRWRRATPPALALDYADSLVAGDCGPEAMALANEDRARITQALQRLPPDYQTVIRLRLLEGRSTEEVAALMDRSTGAVRVLQHRALTRLRSCLREGSD